MAADLCPSIRWTALAFAPDEIANDAADLSVVEVDPATHDFALGLHALGRVRDYAAVIDGVVEDGRQDAVGAFDRRGGPVAAKRRDPVLDRRAADVADAHITPAWLDVYAPTDLERFQRRRLEVRTLAGQPARPELSRLSPGRPGAR